MSEGTERSRCVAAAVLTLATLVAVLPGRVFAQHPAFEVRGYAKDLAIRTTSVLSGDSQFLNIGRFRLQNALSVGPNLRAEVWIDTEALVGNFLDSEEYRISRSIEQASWLDLDWDIASRSKFRLQQNLFRAFARYYAGRVTVTAGRQRIAWGTGFAWNPTDLLNPFNPASIELDEKAGIDALHVSVATGDFSHAEIAIAPASSREEISAAARVTSNWGEYDMSAMGGYFRDDWVVGADFAGYIGDAGLRGEAALTLPDEGDVYLRFTLTVDRSFPGDVYAFAEYYMNGQGTTRKTEYDFARLLTGRVFNVARDYLALSATKAITPLLAGSLYGLLNIDDQSALIGPAFTYSLREDLEVGAAVYVFAGKNDTEFGRQENAYFGYLQWFF